MNLSETKSSARPFSHIYVEKEAEGYELTDRILKKFSDSNIIGIRHYKDVFNRAGQDFILQKQAKSLILAVNHGELIYPGAKVCQSFGNDFFYYTSSIMNCIYDCEYCYLQGMYPSGSIVIFVNIEDYFSRAEEILKEHPMYLCISYDTDLLAMEEITGITAGWCNFTLSHPDLKIEIRTKSAYDVSMLAIPPCDRIIFAWTISPDEITSSFEHNTPLPAIRINAARTAVNNGYTVRLCFDPMIYVPDYREIYGRLYKNVFDVLNARDILDVSLGLFRISSTYIKSMRKKRSCRITMYPYSNIDGVCAYEKELADKMLSFAKNELLKYVSEDKIYII